jgi:hypothetical protein
MNGSTQQGGPSRRRATRSLGVLVAIVLTLIAAGCTPDVPQAVLQVPTTFILPTLPNAVVPSGTVIVCYSGQSKLYIRTSITASGHLDWSPSVGPAHRVWTVEQASGGLWTETEVVEPGCGTLGIGTYYESHPYTGPSTMTVDVTDVAPA